MLNIFHDAGTFLEAGRGGKMLLVKLIDGWNVRGLLKALITRVIRAPVCCGQFSPQCFGASKVSGVYLRVKCLWKVKRQRHKQPACKQLMPRHSSPSVSEEFKKLCVKHSRWKRSRRAFQRHKQKSVSCHRATQTGVSLHSDDFTHWLTSIHSCLFCPFTKPWTSERNLLVTCGVFASSFFVLLHVDIFVFSFLSNHQNTFVTNQGFAHAEDGLQGSLFDSNEYWECGFGCVRWWSMETGRGCLGYWVTEEDAARNEGLRGILQQMEKKMLVG